jgi:hypothetical protein
VFQAAAAAIRIGLVVTRAVGGEVGFAFGSAADVRCVAEALTTL